MRERARALVGHVAALALTIVVAACSGSHSGSATHVLRDGGDEGGDGARGTPGIDAQASACDAQSRTSDAQTGTNDAGGRADAGGDGGSCGDDPIVAPQVLTATTDPEQGVFTMTQALEGLPRGPGPLRALIQSDRGLLTCTLRPDKAPNGVANFVGLARGRRPFRDPITGKWTLRRFYDGLLFHRVLADVVIQGGDPLGTGFGGPGYFFKDEISDLTHSAGTLSYANAGPNTNGSQFYVVATAQPSFDGKYTIFGLCTPTIIVTVLSHVPADANGKPITPEPMTSVTITRCAP